MRPAGGAVAGPPAGPVRPRPRPSGGRCHSPLLPPVFEIEPDDADLDAALDALDHVVDRQGGDATRRSAPPSRPRSGRSWRPPPGCGARPAARSGVTATTRSVRASGWQSGIRSLVRLPPITPASSATPRTSPFGAAAVDDEAHRLVADTRPSASATARRAVSGLSQTSTIRGRPDRSTWVRRRRSERGRSVRGHRAQYRGFRTRRRVRRSVAVEPPQVDRRAGRAARRRSPGRSPGRRRSPAPRGRGSPARARRRRAGPGRGPRRRARCARRASRSATTRRNARRPGLFVTSSRRTRPVDGRSRRSSGRPASRRIAGRTNSSKVTKLETGLPGSPNRSVRAAVGARSHDPEGERLAGLDRDPPQLDPADLLERRPDDVVRPDRHAARHDRSRRRRRARAAASRARTSSSRSAAIPS